MQKSVSLLVVVLLVLAGCMRGYQLRHLEDERPLVRMKAAVYFGEQKSKEAAPHLVRLLEDEDPSVRMFSHAALKKISGKDFGYEPVFEDKESNKASIDKWRQWAHSVTSAEDKSSL